MPDSATSLSVGHVNLLYENDRLDDAIADLRDVGVDVMAFTEYTPEHAAALLDSELAAEYPYRLDRASGLASGTALWSRYPVRETEGAGTANESLSGVVDVDGTEVRVLVVHPRTPVFNLDGWRHDLADIALTARVTDLPTVVIGDFNASWWHPEYRQLVRTADLRDAHQATGDVWTATWPTDRWFPAFVRLDHALVTDDVAVRSTGDFGIAGTDHRGITVVIETAP
jgi:endonuclease/exonuclease/phosphatase (EEP) superfamily protein YafD